MQHAGHVRSPFICVVSVGSACGNFSKAKRAPKAFGVDDDVINARLVSYAGVSRMMSFLISSSRWPTANLAAIFAMGKPGSFEACAD